MLRRRRSRKKDKDTIISKSIKCCDVLIIGENGIIKNLRGAEENRTPDLFDANEARYQLRYSPRVLPLYQYSAYYTRPGRQGRRDVLSFLFPGAVLSAARCYCSGWLFALFFLPFR